MTAVLPLGSRTRYTATTWKTSINGPASLGSSANTISCCTSVAIDGSTNKNIGSEVDSSIYLHQRIPMCDDIIISNTCPLAVSVGALLHLPPDLTPTTYIVSILSVVIEIQLAPMMTIFPSLFGLTQTSACTCSL